MPFALNAIHPRLRSAPPAELINWLLDADLTSEVVRAEILKADPQAIQASLKLDEMVLKTLPIRTTRPVLFVHGKNDPAISAPHSEHIVLLPRHIHQILFENSAHFPMLEEPSKFNRLLVDFLSLPSDESPRQLQLKEEWRRRVR